MAKEKFGKQEGWSLVELMVVLVIVSVLVAVSIAQFDTSKDDFRTQNVAKELQAYLVRARYDSIKRRPSSDTEMASVVINDATSFTVNLDLNRNGTLDVNDSKVIDFSSRTDVSILGDGVTLPVTITFDRHGHVNAFDSLNNLVTPQFVICDKCSDGSADTAIGYRITLSSSGTASMQPTSEVVTTFSAPSVTSVPTDEGVNSLVYVDPNLATPTPSATATPTPTPTATPGIPTPTPTATATPVATATPTPTPVDVCTRNERPSHTGCVCQSPMTVHSNGQCK